MALISENGMLERGIEFLGFFFFFASCVGQWVGDLILLLVDFFFFLLVNQIINQLFNQSFGQLPVCLVRQVRDRRFTEGPDPRSDTVVRQWDKTLLQWEHRDFDFTVGQCFVSDENSAC